MSDERADAIEAVALWLAGEDGDLEDFPTNAGQARDYQMDRARNIVAVVAPHMAGSGEAERLRDALRAILDTREDDDLEDAEAWERVYRTAQSALRVALPDAERAPQPEPRQDEVEAVARALALRGGYREDELREGVEAHRGDAEAVIAALDAARRPFEFPESSRLANHDEPQ